MKGFFQLTIRLFLITAATLVLGYASLLCAANLQELSNGKLISDPENDGDSFFVEADGKTFRIRLYFVDCPETSAASKTDARRVRGQTRHFGLSAATRTIHFGIEAATFVENALAKPFTIHTAFASALGRSSKGRVYAFITTADGDDLASLLVKNGFARTYGLGRKTPDGVSKNEMKERLRDLEISAMLKRVGIWSESNPEKIAEFRAEQRREDYELQGIQNQATKSELPQGLININTATERELRSVKGIGPSLAKRIIAGRPYSNINDLLKVKGIGPKNLKKFRPYFSEVSGW
jgi:competence ComEA-like helix-hairpin-helix protein